MKSFDALIPEWAELLRTHGGQAFLFEVPQDRHAALLRGLKAWLLCPAAATGRQPCGTCLACRDEAHPDWTAVGGQHGRIRLAAVRAFGDLALIPPRQGQLRAFVIQEPEWLGDEAANSLLKLLEESPPHVTWILVTDRPHEVLPTVRSRCRPLSWRIGRVPAELAPDVLALLEGHFEAAGWPERLPDVARALREAIREPGRVAAMAGWTADELIGAWELVSEAYQAIERNANRELWAWRLKEAWRSHARTGRV
jgi:hypothetical protein